MKAWLFHPAQQILEQVERAIPEPGPQQLLVKVRAASLNRGEFLVGGSPAPRICGMEAAGEVVGWGAQVPFPAAFEPTPGLRVMGRASGGFAEFALIDAYDAMPIPEKLAWEEAASIPIAYLVAYDMLVVGASLAEGEWMLIAGASSGVGVACLQMGKVLGVTVIGTSSSPEKLERLAAAGLDYGVCAQGGDFVQAVRATTGGRGVDLAINNLGGSAFSACVAALRFQGRLAQVGFVDGIRQAALDLEQLHALRLKLFGVSNKWRVGEQRALTVRGFARDMLPLAGRGELRPLIDQVFDFEALPLAHATMLANRHVGKLVIRMTAAQER